MRQGPQALKPRLSPCEGDPSHVPVSKSARHGLPARAQADHYDEHLRETSTAGGSRGARSGRQRGYWRAGWRGTGASDRGTTRSPRLNISENIRYEEGDSNPHGCYPPEPKSGVQRAEFKDIEPLSASERAEHRPFNPQYWRAVPASAPSSGRSHGLFDRHGFAASARSVGREPGHTRPSPAAT